MSMSWALFVPMAVAYVLLAVGFMVTGRAERSVRAAQRLRARSLHGGRF